MLVDRILRGVEQLGQTLPQGSAENLSRYVTLLAKWNRAYNLTAVRNPDEMVVRHVLDALAVRPWLQPAGRLVDIGSGPGIPGIILALAEPTLSVTLIDANLKMTRFSEAAVRELAISNVRVIRDRVEALPADQFDQAISRAYAAAADFLSATGHLVRPGGEWLAMKGRLDETELRAVPPHFVRTQTHPLRIPGLDAERHLLIFQREEKP